MVIVYLSTIMAHMEPTKSLKSPSKGRKVERPLPIPVQRALTKLGDDINRARRRRGLTQQSLAERIGASLNTVKRLESGDPRVQLHFLARALHLFGELQRLNDLLDSGKDDVGLALMDEKLPQRVRTAKKSRNAF
ncbi:helix-turn-helix domain-containing protein [Caballeronia humi]|uniref:XRE family transcriptional regulator n=1 Tax=Caballeronia humi TaxID=326474 RepID=A0A158FVX1_9BURK|nr:helix-turn-helix transcriptional regulator [Caballeronia humi]SAL23817.1 XRE family transcriptional regulator [Caballeronia humi]